MEATPTLALINTTFTQNRTNRYLGVAHWTPICWMIMTYISDNHFHFKVQVLMNSLSQICWKNNENMVYSLNCTYFIFYKYTWLGFFYLILENVVLFLWNCVNVFLSFIVKLNSCLRFKFDFGTIYKTSDDLPSSVHSVRTVACPRYFSTTFATAKSDAHV